MRRGILSVVICLWIAIGAPAAFGGPCAPANDPFAPNGIMPSGRFAGQCLDISQRRSFRILTKEEAGTIVPPSELVNFDRSVFLANVGHDGKFWVGKFPKDGVDVLTFLVERFPPRWLAAHSMLRFDFKPGFEPVLFPQVREAGDAPVKLRSFVLSVEGVPLIDGPSFGPITALQEYFGLAKRIVSLDQKVKQVVLDEEDLVRQYRIKLAGKELDAFWMMALHDLHDPEMQQIYHLLKRNCMNALFEVFDHYLGRARYLRNRIATFLPTVTRSALKNRGLWDREVTLATLNDEVYSGRAATYCKDLMLPPDSNLVRVRD